MTKLFKATIAIAALLAATQSMAAETKGAGSTFVSPVMVKWNAAYKAKTGNSVSYQSVGSSVGIGLIKSAAVDFGASDMTLKPEELDKLGIAQFPLVIGGVVPVVNVEGIKPVKYASLDGCWRKFSSARSGFGIIPTFKGSILN